MKKSKVLHDALILYKVLCEIGESSFSQLQKATGFKDLDLCLAICSLLRNKIICQNRTNGVIYYEVRHIPSKNEILECIE
ncbi:winged helix-turn-helix domain-containing protein [Bacteroides uniformis]|uniref:winged helix-turn-helix domain-containing protein n=1 Tax=Bacteroides uniformis TaxID=820 RepID=UPI0035A23C67